MPKTLCTHCGAYHHWDWEEAFDKFGFGDGDGLVMTATIAEALSAAGYTATSERWGLHNTVITSIQRDGVELIPESFDYRDGNPREDLPTEVVVVLDAADYNAAHDALAAREEL